MAAPNNQFDLGTSELNGRDGDTLRQAGEKYNTHTHQTASVQAAIDGADTPSGANVFITESALEDVVEDYALTSGLGTAAFEDAGAGIGHLLQVVDVGGATPGLPAIDGSQLLNLPGGGSGGFSSIVIPFSQAGQLGPAYTTDNAAPSVGITTVGSVHYDADDEEVYYRDSAGWQGPTGAPGAPFTVDTTGPFAWNGSMGDYFLNTTELEFYGPKGTDWGAATSVAGWALIEVLADPVIGDGGEGDYAWRDMGGGAVRVWGPKLSTGWGTEYLSFTGVDTATPKIYMGAPPSGWSGADELWVRPGSGTIIHGGGTASFQNGYTVKRLIIHDPSEAIAAAKLLIGAELESVDVTYGITSGDVLQVKVLLDSTSINLGTTVTPTWMQQPSVGESISKSIIKSSGAGSDIYLHIRYGSGQSLGSVSDVDFTITLFYLGAA